MSIMSIFNGLFRSRDKPANSITSETGRFDFLFGNTMSGKVVNERTALQTTAVLACTKVISEGVASLPLHVYVRKENGDSEKAFNHPLYNLLHLAPNSEMTAYTFIETALTHLLIYGNFYAQIIRDGRGYPTALYPLLPNRTDVSRNAEKRLVYAYTADSGQVTPNNREVLHIPGLEFPDPVKDVQRVKDSWNAGYKGADNAHKVAVLEEGAKFQTIGIPPNEAQFLETRRYQLEEIARIYRVPLHLAGDLEHATFSNVEHMSLDFTKFTLTPWVRRIEQALEKSLLPASELNRCFIKFSVDGLLRGDCKSRMDDYAVGRQNGWLSANDIRELENLNSIPADEGGDAYLVNGSMLPLKPAMEGLNYAKNMEFSDETKT